jgi:hypothetical protein
MSIFSRDSNVIAFVENVISDFHPEESVPSWINYDGLKDSLKHEMINWLYFYLTDQTSDGFFENVSIIWNNEVYFPYMSEKAELPDFECKSSKIPRHIMEIFMCYRFSECSNEYSKKKSDPDIDPHKNMFYIFKTSNPNDSSETLTQKWFSLTESERAHYHDLDREDHDRYYDLLRKMKTIKNNKNKNTHG